MVMLLLGTMLAAVLLRGSCKVAMCRYRRVQVARMRSRALHNTVLMLQLTVFTVAVAVLQPQGE
jgi:hypothetical protein